MVRRLYDDVLIFQLQICIKWMLLTKNKTSVIFHSSYDQVKKHAVSYSDTARFLHKSHDII